MIGYCPLDQDPVELPSRRQDVIPQSRLQKPDKTKKSLTPKSPFIMILVKLLSKPSLFQKLI